MTTEGQNGVTPMSDEGKKGEETLDVRGAAILILLAFDETNSGETINEIVELCDRVKRETLESEAVKGIEQALMKIAFGSLENNFDEITTNKPDSEIAQESLTRFNKFKEEVKL